VELSLSGLLKSRSFTRKKVSTHLNAVKIVEQKLVQILTIETEAEEEDQDSPFQLNVPIVAKMILYLSNQEAIGRYSAAIVSEKVEENNKRETTRNYYAELR